jgi:hypothetical protein
LPLVLAQRECAHVVLYVAALRTRQIGLRLAFVA